MSNNLHPVFAEILNGQAAANVATARALQSPLADAIDRCCDARGDDDRNRQALHRECMGLSAHGQAAAVADPPPTANAANPLTDGGRISGLAGLAGAAAPRATPLQRALAAEFGDFLESRGIKATVRYGAQPVRQVAPPAAEPVMTEQERAERLATLRGQLQAAQVGFDPAYQYTEDYSYWSQQAAKASRIAHLRRQVEQLEAA